MEKRCENSNTVDDQFLEIQDMNRGRKIRKTNQSIRVRNQNGSECQEQEGLYSRQLRLLQFESFYTNKASNFSSFGSIPDADHILIHAFHTEHHRELSKQSNFSSFHQNSPAIQARKKHKTSFHDQLHKGFGNGRFIEGDAEAQKQGINQNQTQNQSQKYQLSDTLYSGPIQLQTLDGNEYFKDCTIAKTDEVKILNQIFVCIKVNSSGQQKRKFLLSKEFAQRIKKTDNFLIESLKSWNYYKEQWEDNFLCIEYY